MIYHKNINPDDVATYDEFAAREGSYGLLHGDEFIKKLFSEQ